MALEVTFDLMSIEKLEGVAAASSQTAWNVVKLHLKLFDLIYASAEFVEKSSDRRGTRARRRRRG